MTRAEEVQGKLTAALIGVAAAKAELGEHAGTLQYARSRIEALAIMLERATEILGSWEVNEAGQFPEVPEIEQAREVAEQETRYWLRQYAAAAPLMERARTRLTEGIVLAKALEEELRPLLCLRPGQVGRVDNPPGASPSIDMGGRGA